uniref:ribosome maturation factor RimM n=1 Tax=Parerythrobacter lutipelagi TaxID=1964208 RepID=UPI0010F435B7|nr:ribosome maturation factor RimM [Parerythrobacter lutipelagi]
MQDKPVTLAAISGAHGVTGEVRLKLFGEGVEALKSHKSFIVGDANSGGGRTLTLKKIRSDNKGGAIARFADVNDRGAAEKLRGTTLSVSRDDLPPLQDGEYYHADLIGLAVFTDAGDAVGTVGNVLNFGAGDIIEIEQSDGKSFLVPMSEQAVPQWDAEKLVIAADFAQ